jgi:hypothetical protein
LALNAADPPNQKTNYTGVEMAGMKSIREAREHTQRRAAYRKLTETVRSQPSTLIIEGASTIPPWLFILARHMVTPGTRPPKRYMMAVHQHAPVLNGRHGKRHPVE